MRVLFAVRLIGLMLTVLFIVVFNLRETRTCLMVSFPSVQVPRFRVTEINAGLVFCEVLSGLS